jgi:GNAT superfamily N-acetyltransferase
MILASRKITTMPIFTSETITPPDFSSLVAFHGLLVNAFTEDEVEPLQKLMQELASNNNPDARARYLCIVLRDPESAGRIASGVYASVQDGVLPIHFILAVRFALVTAEGSRRRGIGREAIHLLKDKAREWADSRKQGATVQGQPRWAYFGECLEGSEAFFNDVLEMRRLYTEDGEGVLREIHYQLPYLGEWARDGRPLELKLPKREHLQLAVDGHIGRLPFEVLEQILTAVWQEWYVCPEKVFETKFDSHQFWEDHKNRVMEETLRGKILNPLRPHRELVLLSREERKQRRQNGTKIEDLIL